MAPVQLPERPLVAVSNHRFHEGAVRGHPRDLRFLKVSLSFGRTARPKGWATGGGTGSNRRRGAHAADVAGRLWSLPGPKNGSPPLSDSAGYHAPGTGR